MGWESLIRRVLRHAPEAAFAGLFGAALLLGGEAALAGAPRLLDALLPGMTAQAQSAGLSAPDEARTRFALEGGFAESRYSPQVLFPVAENPMPDWLAEAVRAHGTPTLRGTDAPPPRASRPVIAIVIDDLGADIAGTDRAMLLPKEVALSFLPYPDTTPFLAEAAAKRGHMILAHVPMQPLRATRRAPMMLETGMTEAEITRRLEWHLARVPHMSGINNHEGSRFTADAASLTPVARVLASRHLFFFDSRTGPVSQVEAVSRAAGIATAGRDIFLDDQPGEAEVQRQLAALVAVARRTGVAIAIGHPRAATLTVLSRWLGQDHGVTLVPLDEAMRRKAARASAFAAR
jgi:polysaccharide deacetylase 2 family uncharacterized protein YibQ